MSEDRKVNLVFAAENQTKGTLQEIKQDVASTATSIEQSGKKAAKGIESMGDGGDKAASKLDGAARSIIGSIQRTTATMEAGEKGSAKYFEALAKQRGVGGDVLEPYLAQLRKAEAVQAASVGGLDRMGMSAKATAAALRGVPAQFTDIAVSLQGGQAPLTVFLQQGGQLKDMFGGAGAAAKALGGYVLGLVNPFTVAAAAVAGLGVAYNQGSREGDNFRMAIVTTGNASGVTASQLREYARQIDSVIGTQAQAADGLAVFVAAGVRGGDELRRYTQTAIEWEKATGQAVEKTAEKFASLQKDPLNGVLKLNEGTNFLTVSVYEQIKALTEQGKNAEASKVAMDALDAAMRERGKTILESLGYIERGWNAITGAAKDAWDKMLGVGRSTTIKDQLAEAQAQLDSRGKRAGVLGEDEALDRGNKKLRDRIQHLQDLILQEDLQAAAQADSTRSLQAKAEWDKVVTTNLGKQAKMELELAQVREKATAAGITGQALENQLAATREKYTEKNNSSRKAAESSYQTLMVAINQAVAASENELKVGEKLTESQKLRIKYEQELATRKRAFSEQEKQNIQAGLLAAEAAEKQAAAAKKLAKAWEEDAKAFDAYAKKQQAQVASINSTVDKLRLEAEGHMLAAAANISHAEAVERITLVRLEEAQAQMLAGAGSQEEIERIQREIAARKELLGLLGQKAAREANKKAAEDAAKEWDKTAQTIGNTLSDYIMGGGKDAAEYLKRLFATLVLQPLVQTAVGGLLGTGSGVGSASAGGSGALGALQSGQSLWSAFSGGLTGTMASGVTQLGSLMGSSFLGELGSGIAAGGQLGIGGTASLMGSAGGTTGLGMALGAAAPWIAGGLAIASLLGGMDFGSRGANHSGGVFSTTTTDRTAAAQSLGLGGDALGDFTSRGNSSIDTQLSQTVGGLMSVYQSLAGYAGDTAKKLDLVAGFAANGVHSDEDAYAYFKLRDQATGQELASYSQRDGGLGSDVNAAWSKYVGDMAGALVGQLKQSDIPGWMRQQLDALGSDVSIEGLNTALEAIAKVDTAFKSFAVTIDGMEKLSGSVQTTLLNVSGGIEALNSNVSGYYANFYSEQEKLADQVESLSVVFGKYGATLPDTKEQYRALVEQQLAAGDAGAEFAAVLLGLNGIFASVADAWKSELDGMATSVTDFFAGLQESIGSLSADVESTRKDILGSNAPMTSDAILAAIGSTAVVGPSSARVAQAQASTASAAGQVAQRQAELAARKAAADAKQQTILDGLNKGVAPRTNAPGQTNDAVWEGIISSNWNAHVARWGKGWNTGSTTDSERSANMDWMAAEYQRQINAQTQARADAQRAADAGGISSAQSALDAANSALAESQKAEKQVRTEYAQQVRQFVQDAGSSVGKLSELRGEVVSFYEAQAQAVQAMIQSAGNLRGVVEQVRMSQLTTAQTAAELGGRYASDYSMALATTGATRAGYVDSMAGNLSGLSEALRTESASGAEWRIEVGKLLAQASSAAGLLEGDAAADDYQSVSLGLLDSIDTALESLSGATKSAEQVIADAVNAGAQAQLGGLRAIVAALQGKAVPAFASGGMHLGGLRLVGENGPELEATGPSRIWNAQQTRALMSGGGSGDVSRLEALLERQLDENRSQAAAMVQMQRELNKLMLRWDALGMPEERVL